MRLAISIILCGLFASGAVAQTVPKEIDAYGVISVSFSENAHTCNLKDPEVFKSRLAEKFAKMGLPQSDDSALGAHLAISGKGFGTLNAQCAMHVSLNFQTILPAQNILTDDEDTREALDRLGQLPIIVYKVGMFGVRVQSQPAAGGESMAATKGTLEMIDMLVDRFEKDRM